LKAYKNKVVKSVEVYGEMHRYIPYLAKNAGFSKIGEKVVTHRKRQYGTSKFGIDRFVHGYLDLFSLYFLSRFGKRPMHFFGLWGSIMFVIGFVAVCVVGIMKIVALSNHTPAPLITSTPYFYLALVTMVLGTQMFLAGFLGEMISRNSTIRNDYQIEEKID
ncbi:MAG: glycosyltransferase, partial [Bacteroidales bacterium]|nr:glycosyltransferase [Bacteroidales bacterium]